VGGSDKVPKRWSRVRGDECDDCYESWSIV